MVIKICPGQKKGDAYNVDFEIFQKAIKGGFIPPFASSENEHETHLPARESSWSVLRRKFAPGDMKEFVSAPKIFLSRVYSESMMIVPSSSSSSLPSSSSPPYLSPDPISSDSSTSLKYFSESSLHSPSAASCSLPVSSTLSSLSNLSLLTSNPSQPLSDVTSQQCLQVAPSSYKTSSLSLAERRGSLSKSLKLPVMTDNMRVTNKAPRSLAIQEEAPRIDKIAFSWGKSDDIEIDLDSADDAKGDILSNQPCKLNRPLHRVASSDTCQKEATTINNFDESGGNCPVEEEPGICVSNVMQESISSQCNMKHLLAFHWPSLERFATFAVSDLDSKAAFAILAPATVTVTGRESARKLYFWVGKSFHRDKSLIQLDGSRPLEDLEFINWNQAGCRVLTQFGFPTDNPIQIIKEDEEPTEFLALFNAL